MQGMQRPDTRAQMHLISQGYVMSNHLVASYLATISEDRGVNSIYAELLSGRGAEIQIRKARGEVLCANIWRA